jgi:hypothetical protein
MTMTECVHHYVLGDPDGGRVAGKCRDCGAARIWKSAYDPSVPFNMNLTRDPLLARVTGLVRLGDYYQ